jgi:hypothetical protein
VGSCHEAVDGNGTAKSDNFSRAIPSKHWLYATSREEMGRGKAYDQARKYQDL